MPILLLKQNRDFRNVWLGQTISYFGDLFYDLAMAWLVFDQTKSALQSGLVLIAGFLPEVLFGLFLGAFADRFNRKRMMQITDFVRALITGIFAVLIWTGSFDIWQIYVITVLMSINQVLFSAAKGAWIPVLVEENQLLTANSILATSMQMSRFVGMITGGVVVAWVGPAVSVLFNSLTFLLSALFVQFAKYIPYTQDSVTNQGNSLWGDVKEGIMWIVNQRFLFALILIGTISNIALGPTNVLPPMFIQKELHANADVLGMFDSAIALGLILGGFLTGTLSIKRIGLWFVVGLGMEGMGMILVSIAPWPLIAYAGNFLLGIGVMVASLPMGTLLQTLTPSHMRGRVNSFSSILFNMAIPFTYGGIGFLADSFGARALYAMGGLLLFLCGLIGMGISSMPKQPKVEEIAQTSHD
ncbi:MFS transporter [Thermicanus aegyptius]|uniref:MFS transporter n=1 Tax=Thermicanus aegyptius TaxID=94009 RepID=UPI000410F579|nr:MFS transporter [Thermicanus aegyptius]